MGELIFNLSSLQLTIVMFWIEFDLLFTFFYIQLSCMVFWIALELISTFVFMAFCCELPENRKNMYHEIQVEDETSSKKSASSTIKSRSRVKSMSKHDQFIRISHFLLAINGRFGVKVGGDWTYFLFLL